MAKASAWKQARRRMLGRLPGEIGLKYRTKYRVARPHDAHTERFEAALQHVAGTTCIDLGANLGEYTRRMAAVAERVIAVEPDPWTIVRLREAVADLPNVEVIEKAAGSSNGTIKLYRHLEFDPSSGVRSESSSVFADKRNVDSQSALQVEQFDLLAYLDSVPGRIGILKIDIEGAEVPILERLFESPLLSRIGYIFCETHEGSIPALAARTDALHRKAARIRSPIVDLYWH